MKFIVEKSFSLPNNKLFLTKVFKVGEVVEFDVKEEWAESLAKSDLISPKNKLLVIEYEKNAVKANSKEATSEVDNDTSEDENPKKSENKKSKQGRPKKD